MRRQDGWDSIPFDNSAGRNRSSARGSNSAVDQGAGPRLLDCAAEGVAEFGAASLRAAEIGCARPGLSAICHATSRAAHMRRMISTLNASGA